jgi:hypothetical protein
MSVEEARLILGKTKNHRRHCKILLKTCSKNSRNCDYIGLGPYQFTTTKQHLSPILGLEGYRSIIEQMKAKKHPNPHLCHWRNHTGACRKFDENWNSRYSGFRFDYKLKMLRN